MIEIASWWLGSTVYLMGKSVAFLLIYTAFHFAHDFVRFRLFAISEAVWEHLKIACYVALTLAVIEASFLLIADVNLLQKVNNTNIFWQQFIISRLAGVLLAAPLVFLFFYFVHSITGVIKNKLIKVLTVVTITYAGGLTALYVELQLLLNFTVRTEQVTDNALLLVLLILVIIAVSTFHRFSGKLPFYPVFEEVIIKREEKK